MDQLIHRYDATAERLVLVTLMLNPEAFDLPEAVFPVEAFYLEDHRRLYRALQSVYKRDGVTDAHLVAMEAADTGWREGPLFLAGLLAHNDVWDSPTFVTTYFPAYAERLRRVYVAREKGKAALQYHDAIAKGMDEDEARVLFDSLLDALDAMDPPGIEAKDVAVMIGEAAKMGTGLLSVDRATKGGLTRPGLNIIAARPSVGKTGLARGIIRHVAGAGGRVFWYSADQSLSQIYALEIAHVKRSGDLSITAWDLERRTRAVEHVKSNVWRDNVVLIDDPLTLPQLVSLARAAQPALVVVDYLQIVDSGNPNEREYDAVTRVSKALKSLALELNAPVLALSQLTRESGPNEAPTLNQLRASGQIEQDADLVLGLQRDTSLASDEPQEATLHILKNKTGPTGTAKLTWMGAYASFEEWAPEPVPGAVSGYRDPYS